MIRPSYSLGFARNADESVYPELWNGLVYAWVPHLGNTGGRVIDVSGKGGHGTFSTPGWTISSRGPAAVFDGTNSITNIPDVSASQLEFAATDSFTVCFSIKATTDERGYLIGKMNTDQGWQYMFVGASNLFYLVKHSNVVTGQSDAVFTETDWINFCGVVTNSTVTFYHNGINAGGPTALIQAWTTPTSVPAHFGQRDGGSGTTTQFGGQVGYCYIYDKVLSKHQILQISKDPLEMFVLRSGVNYQNTSNFFQLF